MRVWQNWDQKWDLGLELDVNGILQARRLVDTDGNGRFWRCLLSGGLVIGLSCYQSRTQ